MPMGVYKRTAWHRRLIAKATRAAARMPRTQLQLDTMRRNVRFATLAASKKPRTKRQLLVARKNIVRAYTAANKMGRNAAQLRALQEGARIAWKLPRSQKQLETVARGRLKVRFEKNGLEKRFWKEYLQPMAKKLKIKAYAHRPLSDFVHTKLPIILWHRRDFVVPAAKLVIETDGCFWHACPKCNLQRSAAYIRRITSKDRQVNKAIRKLGWRVVRFWEHSIRHDDPSIRRVLLMALKK